VTADHLLVAPIVLPLLAAAVLLFAERWRPGWQPAIAVLATATLLGIAIVLLRRADTGDIGVYLPGNWRAPFGIVLVLDRLSALMLVLTAGVGIASLMYALAGWAPRGPHFHAFFQLQLAGLDGAFLTGDLFNLFVFFEVLLIGSYALLLHAAQGRALRAGFRYVVVNLDASSVFLIAVSLLYGLAGTLNMADLAQRLAAAPAADAGLLQAAGLLLLVVFAVKAAVVPFGFWLPASYGAAPAPVAALFALMTKVGVYAILRVSTLLFGADAGPVAGLGAPVLFVLGLATILVGALGAFAARRLSALVAFLVIVSAGTLVATLAAGGAGALAGALYYLVHSTVVAALLFLLVEAIGRQRGPTEDRLQGGPAVAQPTLLGLLFLGAAMVVAGLPPFSGFIGKVAILAATAPAALGAWLWAALLGSGLLVTVALARAGGRLFWKVHGAPAAGAIRMARAEAAAITALAAAAIALSVLAAPVQDYSAATATQLSAPRAYVERVMAATPVASPQVMP
jgi:multicomponent K+:H+ antiporter subunit D